MIKKKKTPTNKQTKNNNNNKQNNNNNHLTYVEWHLEWHGFHLFRELLTLRLYIQGRSSLSNPNYFESSA